MLLALVPLFDDKMAVKAYSIFSQKENNLLNPLSQGTGFLDGATSIPGLDIVNEVSIDVLTDGKEVFIPISNISIFTDIEGECKEPYDKVVLLLDNTIPPVDMYVNRVKELKEKGFKIADRKLAVSEFESQ